MNQSGESLEEDVTDAAAGSPPCASIPGGQDTIDLSANKNASHCSNTHSLASIPSQDTVDLSLNKNSFHSINTYSSPSRETVDLSTNKNHIHSNAGSFPSTVAHSLAVVSSPDKFSKISNFVRSQYEKSPPSVNDVSEGLTTIDTSSLSLSMLDSSGLSTPEPSFNNEQNQGVRVVSAQGTIVPPLATNIDVQAKTSASVNSTNISDLETSKKVYMNLSSKTIKSHMSDSSSFDLSINVAKEEFHPSMETSLPESPMSRNLNKLEPKVDTCRSGSVTPSPATSSYSPASSPAILSVPGSEVRAMHANPVSETRKVSLANSLYTVAGNVFNSESGRLSFFTSKLFK